MESSGKLRPALLANVEVFSKIGSDLGLMPSAEGKLSGYICAFRPSVPPLSGSNALELISNCFITANDVVWPSG